jgi:AraC-like DNA-binding protein
VARQPRLQLVDLFVESTEYVRDWRLPFNSISLITRADPEDLSWCELLEDKRRFLMTEGALAFTTCDTPIRLRYSTACEHCCIHFRYELFPGVDIFSGLHTRFLINNESLKDKIRAVFAEKDQMRKIAMAEHIASEVSLMFWPESLPVDMKDMMQFSELFQYVKEHLDSQLSIGDMASFMGWSDAYFSRKFHRVFHVTPKQYLIRELVVRATGLLNDTGKSIKEIAAELKFSSEFNFSRFIHHYTNSSPSVLRKQQNKGPLYIRK